MSEPEDPLAPFVRELVALLARHDASLTAWPQYGGDEQFLGDTWEVQIGDQSIALADLVKRVERQLVPAAGPLTPEMLVVVREAARRYGWEGDYGEVATFVRWLYAQAGQPAPPPADLEPYEDEASNDQ